MSLNIMVNGKEIAHIMKDFEDFPVLENQFAYVIDLQERRIIANKCFSRYTGYSEHQLDLNFFIKCMHATDRKRSVINRIKNKAILIANPVPSWYSFKFNDGKMRTIREEYKTYYNGSDNPRALLCLCRFLT